MTLSEMRPLITADELSELLAQLFATAVICAHANEPPESALVVDLAGVRDDDQFPDDDRDRAADFLAAVLRLN